MVALSILHAHSSGKALSRKLPADDPLLRSGDGFSVRLRTADDVTVGCLEVCPACKQTKRLVISDGGRSEPGAFRQASEILRAVRKEVGRRVELRQRLEAERGRPMSDEEFLEIADQTGLKI